MAHVIFSLLDNWCGVCGSSTLIYPLCPSSSFSLTLMLSSEVDVARQKDLCRKGFYHRIEEILADGELSVKLNFKAPFRQQPRRSWRLRNLARADEFFAKKKAEAPAAESSA
ncbi:hypothetical protein RJ641_012247 [Dillenia turbinata]|uniref:Uncharacterized protein n=1 Tax=Dillenia turbinata TaxID=194707 RepID=A0AAN8UTW1_9MAGN